jgi:hypothetical protein
MFVSMGTIYRMESTGMFVTFQENKEEREAQPTAVDMLLISTTANQVLSKIFIYMKKSQFCSY